MNREKLNDQGEIKWTGKNSMIAEKIKDQGDIKWLGKI